MALCINDSGTWRNISTQCVNDSGTWRKVATGCINDSGTWRKYGFVSPGDNYEGGRLICQAAGVQWILALRGGTRILRNWYDRDDAVTYAQSCAACGDWFVPTIGQLQNPGYTCRTYWDSIVCTGFCEGYWSSSEHLPAYGKSFSFRTGNVNNLNKAACRYVRAFRCVTY